MSRKWVRAAFAAMLVAPAWQAGALEGPVAAAATPLDTPVTVLWQRMFERHDLPAWQAANKLSSELYGNGEAIDAGLCRQRDQALQQSLRDDPVSLVLWDIAYRCAAAVGDDALAAQRGQAMAALLKQSLDARPLGEENTPIRISTNSDAFTLIRHSGQQLLYVYYDVFSNTPPMTLHAAMWDASAQRERWLSFDVSDSLAQLSGDPKLR